MSDQKKKADDGPDLEWLVSILGNLGMNRVRLRWKLAGLVRWWRRQDEEPEGAAERGFRHQSCWRCRQIRDIEERQCGNCGARLGSHAARVMRTLGLSVPPSLTVSSLLVAINVAIYVRVWLVDRSSLFALSPEALHLFGAHGSHGFLDPSQWWRIGAAMFLHFNLLHIGMNMFSLVQVGPSLEELLGRGEVLFVYMLTGLVGNLVSELRPTPFIGAGASGALMGLVGLAAGLGHASRSAEGREIRNRMLKWGGYTLAFGLAIGADNLAHAGGFIAGGVWGLIRGKRVVFGGQPPSHPALGVAGVVLLLASAAPPLLVPVSPEEIERPPKAVRHRRRGPPAEAP